MTNIFISHSHRDSEARQYMRFLNEHLPSLGTDLIAVSDTFEHGEDLQKGIAEKINKCSIFISFFRKDNPNVMFELGYALAKNKKIILIGDVEDIPVDLRNMIYLPKGAHPFEVLKYIEKSMSGRGVGTSSYNLELQQPQQTIRMLLERPELLDNLEPRELEKLVMQWFITKGYRVELATASHDYGFDLLVQPFRGDCAIVEVKKYKSESQVPLAVIRQLVGAMSLSRIRYGIIVSTAPFPKSAAFFVKDIQSTVLLWTLEDLATMDTMPNKSVETYISPCGDTGGNKSQAHH